MRAQAVVGASFGDEGKGLVVDYLCAKGGVGVVVRYCGSANAGHTVVLRDGTRHVFKHFGAGTLRGVPTFFSEHAAVNPIAFFRELDELHAIRIRPAVYAHPDCLVVTFADMLINQCVEDARAAKGTGRHGSTGMGLNETITRSQVPELKITFSDLLNGDRALEQKLVKICTLWAAYRAGKPLVNYEPQVEAFVKGCEAFAHAVVPAGIGSFRDPLFEGSQGLLLDQDNEEYYPHVTRSSTGLRNVRMLCAKAGISELNIDSYYVSRTYLTRHGAGPLPGEDLKLRYPDDTNLDHPYQGRLRFAPLDYLAMRSRCERDAKGTLLRLVLTHADQLEEVLFAGPAADLASFGPTAEDVVARPVMKRVGAGM